MQGVCVMKYVWLALVLWFLAGIIAVLWDFWTSGEVTVNDALLSLLAICLGIFALIAMTIERHGRKILWRRKL